MLDQLNTVIGFVSVMLLLSMIITVVVQAISALLDLRGQNLVWALTNLFQQIHPDSAKAGKGIKLFPPGTKTAAEELATAVLTHNGVTSTPAGNLYKAKAIRPDELLMVLQKLSQQALQDPTILSDAAKNTLNALLTDTVAGDPGNTEILQKLSDELNRRIPMLSTTLQNAIGDIVGKTILIKDGMARWFPTIMDRASDRFTRNCRFWTIAGAAVLAFGFHVDSIDIYRKVSSDPTLRAKLVANADSLQQQAEKVMGTLGTQSIQALANDSDAGPDDKAVFQQAPADLMSCNQGHAWLVSRNTWANKDKFVTKFDSACQDAAKQKIAAAVPELAQVKKQLADADFQLLDSFGWPDTDPKKLRGQFVTLLLLSLGAPFWFNALRQLSNLKPAISDKVAAEKKAAEERAANEPDKAKAASASASGKA